VSEDDYPTDPDSILTNPTSAIEYFNRRKQDCEEYLRRVRSIPDFRIVEKTLGSPTERDITAQEIDRLEHSIRDYQRIIDTLMKV